jgi:hypothetical protein
MKTRKQITGVFVVLITLLSFNAKSDVIKIDIIGQGKVTAIEANIDCSDDCSIDNKTQISTLVATAATNWSFKGWQGQQCDAGNGVIVEPINSHLNSVQGGSKTLVSADVNGDGVFDLATISLFDGKVSILTNKGVGKFDVKVIAEDLNYPSGLSFYDWENDGDQDLIVAVFGESRLKLYLNDGNGELRFSKDIIIENIKPYSVAVTDFNDDQQPDLVISSFSADTSGDLFSLVNSITLAKTETYLNQSSSFVLEEKLSDNAAITLDAYFSPDSGLVVVAAEIIEDEIALYTNSIRSVIDTKAAIYGVSFGDIDNNGTLDILAASYRPSMLTLYYNQGDNRYSSGQVIAQPIEGLTATAIVDINADGYVDVATGEFNLKQFYYYKTVSYRDCIVNQGNNISLIAEFEQGASPEVVLPSKESNSSSSGGTFSWFLMFIILMLSHKKK